MKKIILIFFMFILYGFTFGYQELVNELIDKKQVNLIKVILDGNHKIVTAVSQTGQNLDDLVNQEGGVSGINGAYFCPSDYPHCGGVSHTDAHRVYKGEKNFKYGNDLGARGMFGFDKSGDVLFILNNLGYVDGIDKKLNESQIDNLYYGIANFPVLVVEWKNVISESLNLLDNKMKTKGTKSFICMRSDFKTVLMGTVNDVTVEEMAEYLNSSLNCYNAINLDSGGSLGMIYNGKTIRKSGRKIMDAFVVVEVMSEENHLMDQNTGTNIIQSTTPRLTYRNTKLLNSAYTLILNKSNSDPEYIRTLISKINIIKPKFNSKTQIFLFLSKLEEYCVSLVNK